MNIALDPNTAAREHVEGFGRRRDLAKDMPRKAATKQRENVLSQREVRPGSTSPGTEQQRDTTGVTGGERPATNFTNPMCIATGPCDRRMTKRACHGCTMAWAEQPREDQIRRWAEAVAASEAVPA